MKPKIKKIKGVNGYYYVNKNNVMQGQFFIYTIKTIQSWKNGQRNGINIR